MFRFAAASVILCAGIVIPVAGAEPPTIAAYVETLENLTLGPSAQVSGAAITASPNMTFRLASGSAAPLMAGNENVGLFFSGQGSFEYRTSDATEAESVKFQAGKTSDFKVTAAGGTITLTGTFQQLYLRSAGVKLPALDGPAGADLGPAFTSQREEMGRQRWDGITHLLAKQKFDNPQSPVALAVFSGSGKPGAYVLDSIDGRNEALYSLLKNRNVTIRELMSLYWPAVVSDQPIGRSRKTFLEPLYLLTDIDYTLVADEKDNASLVITETIAPRIAAQRVYRFDLHSTVYDSGGRPRQYNVRSVKDAAGNDLSYHHDKGSFIVGLPRAVAANQPMKIRFEIEGNFLYRPEANSFWQLGTEPWFPQPDLNGQYYTIHSTVKVKKPWIAFAPGETIRRAEEGDYNVVENRISKPVQFAVVHAGKYAMDEKTYEDGLTVRVASYAMSNERAMKQLNNLAWKMIKFYEPWLGPFPFKELNIIEINDLGYAQAPPGTMFITKEAFNPTMGDDNKLFSQGINHRFAHEIAHQYWGHVIKMGSREEQWVTEAFAEYSSSLAIKQLKGMNGYKAMLATWRADANDSKNVSSIALANRINIPGDQSLAMYHRRNLLYQKGAYVIAAIHQDLGDDKFLTFMRSLQGIFAWKYLTTNDIAALLQRISGKDYTAFFDRYFWGTEMPKM